MMCLTLSDGQEISWHAGDPKPDIRKPIGVGGELRLLERTVTEIYVDGDELGALFPYMVDTHCSRGGEIKGYLAHLIYEKWEPEEPKEEYECPCGHPGCSG